MKKIDFKKLLFYIIITFVVAVVPSIFVFDDMPEESWCLDGEEMKHKKKSFNFYISKEINVLLPKENIDKLFVEE